MNKQNRDHFIQSTLCDLKEFQLSFKKQGMSYYMKDRLGYGVPHIPTLELATLQGNGLRISDGHETLRQSYILPHMRLVSLDNFHGF